MTQNSLRPRGVLVALALVAAAGAAQALSISSFSPQGEVARVKQVVAKFDVAAVRFGDPKAAAPLTVSCDNVDAGKGSGRWTGDREWVFDFADDLPPGVRCSASVVSAFKSPTDAEISGQKKFQFNTGGPYVRYIEPSTYTTIDEEQFFVLPLNGPATLESVRKNIWCVAGDVGERIPVKLIEGKQREALLKGRGLERQAARDPLSFVTLACNRRLSPGTTMQIVFGKGVATPSGVANSNEKRFSYTVRAPFKAEFTCERESAQSGCLPIRAMSLTFNAPVARKNAEGIRLKSSAGSVKPGLSSESDDADAVVTSVQFPPPFTAGGKYTIELPKDFQDASGRTLSNAASFPLAVGVGQMPPLAKFAASPFGIVERFAEGPGGPALLPVTLRNVEQSLAVSGLDAASAAQIAKDQPAKVSTVKAGNDAEIIRWYRKVQRYNEWSVGRSMARQDVKGPLPPKLNPDDDSRDDPIQTRSLSLLRGQNGVKTLDVPKSSGDPRPFEVVGIPLAPGFHVVEIASPMLGKALLSESLGEQRTMYVRTSALVTNLAVHFKLGRENSQAWVTTLDKGQVVPGAVVRVSTCDGSEVQRATTNEKGIAVFDQVSSEPMECHGDDEWSRAYFVSVRAKGADGVEDMAFTWSDWQRGIEPWRFNVPTSQQSEPDAVAHTVFDRTLLRAGETVSMKHYLRTQTMTGFDLPDERPNQLVITHTGSGQQFTQDLVWRETASGGLSAENSFHIPPAAKLGVYSVSLNSKSNEGRSMSFDSGSFRVEEFRLPVFEGRVTPAEKKPLVRVRSVPVDVQINYISGGPAARLPVRVSAMVRGKSLSFPDFDAFSFQPPRQRGANAGGNSDNEEPASSDDIRIIEDKLPLTLNATGAGRVTIGDVPQSRYAQQMVLEATYSDPNGEVQTLRSSQSLWPAAVIAGIKTEGWVSAASKMRFQALALSLDGKVQADVPVDVQAIARITTTSRKRMVGGFYSYDNKTETKDLGTVCSGKTDSRGLLLCEAKMAEAGEIELIAKARDKEGNESLAASTVWVTRQGELWFGGEDHDRIDVLPEKKNYQPGETAQLQVRMPFRFATALVTVEREGILSSEVVQLNGQDPTVHLKIQENWGPNVYVSVFVLRGRLREVPWYSFFTWGFKSPREWWTAFWYEGKEYVAPTAMVDLSKPAYRFGMTELRVGTKGHQIDVKVTSDKESYAVRGKAQITVQATLPDGKPAAGAEIALAAVDQALLELMPNNSWNLLEAMLQRRSWGVETSTAQMEIIGRRHYGKKAVPAGGGGGSAQARELLETLLLWKPSVRLDDKGQAKIEVPLNDALTTFKIVAIADAGVGMFGTGSTSIRATQDLQIISGLPPLVREDDQFRAQITLRNTTKNAMKVEVSPRAALLSLDKQTVEIPAGDSREVSWNVTAPAQLAQTRAQALMWEIEARDLTGGARDALKVTQRLIPAIPLTVQQGTLVQVDGAVSMSVAPPADAVPGRGGLKLAMQPKLAEGLPAVRDWWINYPFICLEQKTSKAVGLRDGAMWQVVMSQLPTYLDNDGLAMYFPPRAGDRSLGSDTLSAYLLSAANEVSGLHPEFTLPQEAQASMINGLIAFVEGRIQRNFWSPRKDLDMRKITAVEALSRYGKATPRMLTSIQIAPNQWPTHAVIDWFMVLRRMKDIPERDQKLAEATQILRARLSFQGTKVLFSTERDDYWWWLMQNGDVNMARLLIAVMNDPAWKDDIGRIANGFIARQQNGAWHTTSANFWGGLALEKFSAVHESVPVAGFTKASLGSSTALVDWSKVERVKTSDAAGAPHQTTWFGAPASPGNLKNNTMFLPWGSSPESLNVTQVGTGKPWLTVQSVAAVRLKEPFAAGYSIKRTVTPVEQADKSLPANTYSRGDVLRVKLEVNASADMTWVAITDPVPTGATILGSGLGRDSEIATQGEKREGWAWPAFEERSFESFRSYYQYIPKGTISMEYTVRLNNAGQFSLPPSRVEALYAPEMFGEFPNASLKVVSK
ncbi:alpha-2-macroglobulin [Diaphorobacter ruginosibacter]|uniref:Alpha-2-macroglobulin n=1 Tax=Diaphorobacter ruginosibacter TaxID=1715720 RepID=A0A7G9RL78_9BURK|nr:MG2 domain-containing protein [Diaphorobacter ruginosibacter]QNN56353.1 alpha-2-macroglobulin [Diaphorobacter ruginosibacter]